MNKLEEKWKKLDDKEKFKEYKQYKAYSILFFVYFVIALIACAGVAYGLGEAQQRSSLLSQVVCEEKEAGNLIRGPIPFEGGYVIVCANAKFELSTYGAGLA